MVLLQLGENVCPNPVCNRFLQIMTLEEHEEHNRTTAQLVFLNLFCVEYCLILLKMKEMEYSPVLKIEFGPPPTGFGSVGSPPKMLKCRHMQQTTKITILCTDTLSFPEQIQFCRLLL